MIPAGIVRLYDETGTFRGTGIVVDATHVVTCAHVVCRSDAVIVSTGDGADERRAAAEVIDVPSTGTDIAVVRTETGFDGGALAWVEQVSDGQVARTSGRLSVFGFGEPDGQCCRATGLTIHGALFTDALGVLSTGQVVGGVPAGCSGSPLVMPLTSDPLDDDPAGFAVVGMFVLGRDEAGQSVFYGADLVLAAVRAAGGRPRTIAASQAIVAAARLRRRERRRQAFTTILVFAAMGTLAWGLHRAQTRRAIHGRPTAAPAVATVPTAVPISILPPRAPDAPQPEKLARPQRPPRAVVSKRAFTAPQPSQEPEPSGPAEVRAPEVRPEPMGLPQTPTPVPTPDSLLGRGILVYDPATAKGTSAH